MKPKQRVIALRRFKVWNNLLILRAALDRIDRALAEPVVEPDWVAASRKEELKKIRAQAGCIYWGHPPRQEIIARARDIEGWCDALLKKEQP